MRLEAVATVVLALVLPLLLAHASAAEAVAAAPLPYGAPFLEQLRDEFFDAGLGQRGDPRARVALDSAKLEAFRERTQRKLRFVSVHVERYERLERGRSSKKARARVRKRDTVIALKEVLRLLEQLEVANTAEEQHDLAARALTIDYATRAYTDPIGSIKIPVHLWNMVFDWSLPSGQRRFEAAREAGNLVDPETGRFLTPEDLRERITRGEDLSLLDPPTESPFWRAIPDIASVDIFEHYLGGGIPVQHGDPAVFPKDGVHFDFEKPHLTQSKPKLDVRWKDAVCRARPESEQKACARSYKLKFGMETHADPVANSLIAALGYNADLAKHLKNVRVNLGDFSFEELDRQWTAYFDQQRVHTFIPLRSVLLPGDAGRGRDEGGEYIVFQEAVAEYKPSEIERIGFWAFGEGLASTAREARALHLFNVWIGNADMKDEENNKLSLRAGADGEWQMYLTQQDLGHSLGLVLPERVDAFPWDAVEVSPWSRFFGWIRGRAELNYVNLQQAGLEWNSTWADAKWMARRIAQLTRAQIEVAVALGRWPEGPRALYVEKLIHRRNQFVTLFDLEADFPLLAVDRNLTTADGSVVNGELVRGRFPDESPIDYGNHFRDMWMPAFDYAGDGLTRAFQAAVGSVDELDPGIFEIGGNWRVAPGLSVKVSRRVYPNPDAQGRFDQHIVQDTLRLGGRVGFGQIGFIEGGVAETLSIAYPVPSVTAGIYARDRLLPLFLPREIRRGALPSRYVLTRERTWRGGASVRSNNSIEITGGGTASLGRVFTQRTIVDHRDAAPLVYRDAPRYWDGEARVFARLWVVDIPFAKASRRRGSFDGKVWRIDPEKLALRSDAARDQSVFEHIVRSGDTSEVERVAAAPAQNLVAKLDDSRGWIGLFFASLRSHTRTTQALQGSREEWQYERVLRATWSFFDNGEEHTQLARALQSSDESAVHLRWFIDDLNTGSDELDRYYASLRALAPASDFLAAGFVASDWEVSGEVDGRWTRMKSVADLYLHRKALERLCKLDDPAVFSALASALGVEEDVVERTRRSLTQRDLKRRSVAWRRLLPRGRDRVRRTLSVLRKLRSACEETRIEARLQAQAEALFAATRATGAAFDPVVLGALLEAAGLETLAERGELLLEARIFKAFEDEHNMPERRDLVGRIGKLGRRVEATPYPLLPDAGVEHWTQLDWARAAE